MLIGGAQPGCFPRKTPFAHVRAADLPGAVGWARALRTGFTRQGQTCYLRVRTRRGARLGWYSHTHATVSD